MHLKIRAMLALLPLMASLGLGIQTTAAGERFVLTGSWGGTQTFDVIGDGAFRQTTGSVWRTDQFGNSLEYAGETYAPHSGWLPSSEAISIGMRWTHNYRQLIRIQRRTRTCHVEGRKMVSVGAGSFDAWVVECDNKKSTARYPMNETIWFTVGSPSVRSRQLLRYHRMCIKGCSPKTRELTIWTIDGAAVASFE